MLFFFIVRVRTFSFWLRSNRKHYSTVREWQYIGFRNLHEVDVNLTHYGYEQAARLWRGQCKTVEA